MQPRIPDIGNSRHRQGFEISIQGSKLGWSCGPSLPELLADHQIVLCGGPVVYWKPLTINFAIFLTCAQILFITNVISFSIQLIYCKVFSNVLYGSRYILSAVFDFNKTIVQLAKSGPPEIWQDHQISRASGPMVHCLEMLTGIELASREY